MKAEKILTRWGSSIFVSPVRKMKCSTVECCHLFVLPGCTDDLHGFAAELGLRGIWCQPMCGMPTYFLTPRRRARAVDFGAVEVSSSDLRAVLRLWRTERKRQVTVNLVCQFREDEMESRNVPQEERGDGTQILSAEDAALEFEKMRKLIFEGGRK